MFSARLRRLLVAVGLLFSFSLRASVTVTGASGGSAISASTAAPGGSGAWTTLGNISIVEGNKADIRAGTSVTLILKPPAGFEFNTNSSPSTSFSSGGDIQSVSATVTDPQTLQVTLTVINTASKDTLTIGPGLQVRPTQTSPLIGGNHIFRPTTGGGTASINGLTTSTDGSSGSNFGNLTEVAGPFMQLLLLLPGETAAPGTANGKTGSPSTQTAGIAFTAVVNAADQYWNLATSGNDVIHLASSDSRAVLPPNTALVAGSASLGVTFKTVSTTTTLTASDVTDGTKTASTDSAITVNIGAASALAMAVQPSAQAVAGVAFAQQPIVFIEDSAGNIRSNDSLTITANLSGGGGLLLGTTSITAVNGVATFINLAATAATNMALQFTGGTLAAATSSAISVSTGPFSRLLMVLPGETAAPGTTTGRSGSPTAQQASIPFTVSVTSVDGYWNQVGTNDTVHFTSNDPFAVLPADAPLTNGTGNFRVALWTAATNLTVAASDVTHPGISPGVSSPLIATNSSFRTGPVVAIHDSELTRTLETTAASSPTPTGPGTTGMQWWPTNWHYFFMPESLKEALRSDGTAFQVVNDADIAAGRLLGTNGRPAFPIVISLASEAINDAQIAPLTNYVAAGGFLFIGSSAFTRNPDGTTRGDFAFAREMGIHMVVPGLTNWRNNLTFTKLVEHSLATHIPSGVTLNWEMPVSADEIPWGIYPHPTNPNPAAPVWQVVASNATVIAWGDAYPCLLDRQFGSGHFLYYSPLQPLMGNSGWSPGMYSYVIFRKAIEWAFNSAKLPVPRLSPWPYAYDAALMVRHDLEDYQSEINNIETFAQFEKGLGAKGDYYFCTGTLRVEMPATYDTNAVLASLRRAITNDGATISSHNGGLPNPYNNPPLMTNSYDFWHWGPDEALGAVPAGFPDGRTYALTSVSNSFMDIEGWFPGLMTNGMRVWVAPYFDGTREASLTIQTQLNVKANGEQKLTCFPHWTISTATSGLRYPMVTFPVSDWFVGSTVSQAMESGHTITTERALVDFYYNLGALINLYGHHLNTNDLHGDYVAYSMNTNLHPRLWPANAISLYRWWLQRSNAQMTASSYVTNRNQSVTTFSLSGGSSNSAVEFLLPSGALTGLQVFTNGVLAGAGAYRTNGATLKLLVGTSVTSGQVRYTLGPSAVNDLFPLSSGPVLTVPPPGILTNDSPGIGGSNLTAVLVTGPTNGTLNLSSNGGFTYTPTPSFSGIDSFTYVTQDGAGTSVVAVVTLSGLNPAKFSDNFVRGSDPGPLAPWVSRAGTWAVTGGELLAGTNATATYANVFLTNNWSDYAAQAQLRFPVGAFGAGLGGRLNPLNGAHYAVWLYPEGSVGGSNVLKLIKFSDWADWTLVREVKLAAVGTNWHTLKLAMFGNQLAAFLDGAQLITVADSPDTAFLNGGVSLDMWTDAAGYQMAFDGVAVIPLVADDTYLVNENSLLNIGPPGVLANDTDVFGSNLTTVAITAPANGTLTMGTNGAFTYMPGPNFLGSDAFIYQANDGGVGLGTAWVRLTVQSSSSPPVFQSINVSNGAAVLTWSAVAGRTYRLQYESALGNANWSNSVPDITATGPLVTATNALNNSTVRFYRVLLLP